MRKSINLYISTILLSSFISSSAFSTIVLDRTRIVFNGDQKSVSLTITNKNNQLPYLAQDWIEKSQGQKITSTFSSDALLVHTGDIGNSGAIMPCLGVEIYHHANE